VNGEDVGVYQAYATDYYGLRGGDEDWWYLAHIYIKPEYRSFGIGSAIIKKDISADLTILEIVGSDLLVKLDAGMGTDTLMNTVLSLLHKKIPEGLIEKRPDRQLMLHLGSIEQVKTVFDAIQVDDIHVLTEGLEVEGGLK
jgi:GNAT superfamily N-acetyltransferase